MSGTSATTIGERARESKYIEERKIHPSKYQLRNGLGDISPMAGCVDAHSIISPIIVRPHPEIEGEYECIDGNLRLAAGRLLHAGETGSFHVPCIVLDNIDDTMAYCLALAANCAREDLTPADLLAGLSRLRTMTEWSARDIARRLGTSNSTVSVYLRVADSPRVASLVTELGVPITLAHAICDVPDSLIDDVIGAVVGGQIRSVKALHSYVARPGLAFSPQRARRADKAASAHGHSMSTSHREMCDAAHLAEDDWRVAAHAVAESAHDAMSSTAARDAWAAAGVDPEVAVAAGWGYLDEPVSAAAGARETIDLSAGLLVPVRRGHTDDLDALVVLGDDGRWQITVGGLS